MANRTELKPPELHTGDILFYSGNDRLSKVIRTFTLSEFSHVAIVASINHSNKTCQVAEALDKGFVISTKSFDAVYGEYSICRLQNEIPRILRRALRSEILKLLGTPYGFLILSKLAYAKLFKVNYLKNPQLKTLICSEAVVVVYDRIGFVLTGMPPDRTTPADLFRSKHLSLIWKKFKN